MVLNNSGNVDFSKFLTMRNNGVLIKPKRCDTNIGKRKKFSFILKSFYHSKERTTSKTRECTIDYFIKELVGSFSNKISVSQYRSFIEVYSDITTTTYILSFSKGKRLFRSSSIRNIFTCPQMVLFPLLVHYTFLSWSQDAVVPVLAIYVCLCFSSGERCFRSSSTYI